MRKQIAVVLAGLACWMIPLSVRAQSVAPAQAQPNTTTTSPAPPPTSRQIPFEFETTRLPFGSTQTVTVQVWDALTGGTLIFAEVRPGTKVGLLGEINFLLGSLTNGGIPAAAFPSGASRYVDVLNVSSQSVLYNGRKPLYADPFALSPGPQGIQGPAGPQGPQGPSGANGLSGSPGPQGPQGPAGPLGPTGPLGPAGTNGISIAGPPGQAGINNRGAWDGTAQYSANDAVSDGGSYWLALAANNASQPSPTNTNWQQLAAAGAPGVAGTQGNTGPQGPKGDQGLMGLPGPPGLPGQNPVGAALTTTSNTFAGNQTVNGSLIFSGPSSGIQFADGTQQNTAVTGAVSGVPLGFMILGITPTPPAGYSLSGAITVGNTWFSVASLPAARGFLAAATLNGKIYAIGGSTASANVSTMDVFDPSTNTWSTAAPMPTARANLAAAAVKGKIYAIGGFGGPDVVQAYDPTTNNWSPVASLITGRTSLATAVVNGRIYAIGGRDSSNNGLSTVEVYDPGADIWTPVSSMSFARYNLAAASVNGKIYAMGGTVSKVGIVFFVEAYDPATDTWSSVAHMPVGPATLGAATVNGKIYAIGGQYGGNALNSVQVYDPTTDSWNQAAPMSVARGNLGVAEANGLIYAVGGTDNSGTVLNSVEQYSPPVTIYTFIKN